MERKRNKTGLTRALQGKQARQYFRTFQEFTRLEASGGIVLLAAALLALVWANSSWAESYFELWHIPLSIQIGGFSLSHDLHWWINEALMVVFFFVVGLEIKREVLVGELSSIRQATLPIAAAAGGMLLPAGLYALINFGTPGISGWAVPMATDIAFALGVMALLGSRVPIALKIFLTALAIVDDLGAVLVIALFYTAEIHWLALAVAGGFLTVLLLANLSGVRSPIPYLILGIGLWLAVLQSGLHATLAGVLLALTIPARGKIRAQDFLARARSCLHEFEHAGESDKRLLAEQQQEALISLEDAVENVETPLQRLEHALHPAITFIIVPLFALANAGVSIEGGFASVFVDRISLGVIVGLVLGKQLGVSLAAWLAVKARLADLPSGVNWKQIYATGWLAGIGFTMSLFISSLAFSEEADLESAKIGILAASLLASIVGYYLMRLSLPKEKPSSNEDRSFG
jgi:NhaA family Na+:H+ antiporter